MTPLDCVRDGSPIFNMWLTLTCRLPNAVRSTASVLQRGTRGSGACDTNKERHSTLGNSKKEKTYLVVEIMPARGSGVSMG